VIWVELVFRCGGEYTEEIKENFGEMFPESRVIHRNVVRQLIDKFRETESVAEASRSGRPRVLTEDKVLDTSERKMQSSKKSIRKQSQKAGVSFSSTQRALEGQVRLHSNKITSVHEEGNLDVTFFSDEAWFLLSGHVNSQNSRVWSAFNPH
jgi:hypothetical protein